MNSAKTIIILYKNLEVIRFNTDAETDDYSLLVVEQSPEDTAENTSFITQGLT